jgi:gamma-glutamyl-gamma-aminobutyrate hydrolase PuuD
MRIGLSQRILFHKNRAYDSIEHSWYEFLKEHTLVFIPNRLPVIIPDIDCLIITGGDNHDVRNEVEQQLIRHFYNLDVPIIGICHGCQLLTKMYGGECTEVIGHMDRTHKVHTSTETYTVNSYHSLCIDYVPPGATVLARDEADNPEAWIHGNLAGVMWHPERMNKPWIPDEIGKLFDK